MSFYHFDTWDRKSHSASVTGINIHDRRLLRQNAFRTQPMFWDSPPYAHTLHLVGTSVKCIPPYYITGMPTTTEAAGPAPRRRPRIPPEFEAHRRGSAIKNWRQSLTISRLFFSEIVYFQYIFTNALAIVGPTAYIDSMLSNRMHMIWTHSEFLSIEHVFLKAR